MLHTEIYILTILIANWNKFTYLKTHPFYVTLIE